MSVPKMRIASPKRVTMVTSASRINGDGPALAAGTGAGGASADDAFIGRLRSLRA